MTSVVKDRGFEFGRDGVAVIPENADQMLGSTLTKKKAPSPKPKSGRTILIEGTLASHQDMGPFFKNILQPIASQQPDDLTIEIHVRAHFEEDPGSGLDAALDDGFDNDAFPDLRRENQ